MKDFKCKDRLEHSPTISSLEPSYCIEGGNSVTSPYLSGEILQTINSMWTCYHFGQSYLKLLQTTAERGGP